MPRRALLLSLLALAIPAGAAGATGDLTQLADPFGCNYWGTGGGVCTPTTALHQPEAIALSPDGKSVYVAVSQSEAVVQFQRDPATGAIDQPSDPTGCVSDTGSGPCVDGERLQFPDGVAVSPDGKNVYVAASNSGAVAIMDRDPTTGLLTQRTAGPLGCVTADGSSGECATAAGLVAPDDVEVSPDGKGVYVVGGNTLVTLNRDPTTGDLSANGCVNETAVAPCADGRAIYDVRGVAISPDSKTVVTTSAGSSGVYDAGMAVFDRDPATNVLTQRSNLEGCFTSGGSGGTCTDARDVDVAFDAAFSADGKNVYVPTRIGAIAIFDRAPATGLITQKAGIDGCITDSSFDATSQTCTLGHSLPYLTGAVVSPDGMSVYASSQDLGGVAIFDRDPSNGRLVQRASPAGCVASAAAYQAQCAPVKQMLTAWDIGIDPLSRNVYVAAHSDRIGVLAREGGGATPTSIPTATPSPGATPSPTVTATPTPTRLPPTLPPSRILRIIVNNRNGNLTVSAQVPGPGRIVVQADGSYRVVERAAAAKTRKLRIAKAAKTVSRASKISLVLKPKGKAKTMLHRTGKLKATLRQTFTPANGTKGSVVTKKVTFKYARKTG